ncbi:MAG TPA: TonB-dependent receptor [Flavobacteriaceae bacterium]|nr:TonB-dependent receptor [Flavobacteriaceae bacterium]
MCNFVFRPTLLFLFLFTPFILLAQSNRLEISGRIVDEENGEPLAYATISILDSSTKQILTGGITDDNGNFSVETSPGVYDIKFEFISFKTETLQNQNINSDVNLGTIKLAYAASSLNEVFIRAETTEVDIRLDKKIYNIGKDLTTQGATVTDALANVPSVTVDVDGVINLRGNSNVTVLINGKPSALTGFGSDALQQLPADAIERVEVITSPSARYSAEGTAGIINIILRKEKTLGFNGSVTANMGFPLSSSASANLNFRTDNFNIFNTSGYYFRNGPGNAFFDNHYLNYEDEDGNLITPQFDRVTEDREYERLREGFYTNLGIEYYLNEKSSIIASGFMRLADDEENVENFTRSYNSGVFEEGALRKENGFEEDKSYEFSLNYFNNFNDEGHKLTVDFQYENDTENRDISIIESMTYPNSIALPSEKIFEKETQEEIEIKADYVLPMGDAQFEAGYLGEFENEVTDYLLMNENASGEFEVNENLTNIFDYSEQVNALYSQYGNKFGDFSFLLGLRLEHTRMKGSIQGDFDATDVVANFDKDYLGLFPTLHLTYEFQEDENITLGYNRRINRPRGWYINPFPSRSSRTNIFQGNPNLDPAYSNTFDLGYLRKWDELTFTTSVYYQHEENAFERVQEGTGEFYNGVEIIRSIPINLSSNDRYGFEAGLIYNPEDWLRLNGSFNFFKYTSEGVFNGVDYGASNSSWFARLSSKVVLPGKIDWQTTAFYRGPREDSQTETDGIFSLNLALSKDIIDDKATISFNVRDLLDSRKRNALTTTERFIQESEFQWRSRTFNLSFTYRFNQQNKRKAPQENFEENGGEMNGGGF